jgi:hypothetical protein
LFFYGKRLIFSVIPPPPAMSDFPNVSIFGIIYDINRKQHRSRFWHLHILQWQASGLSPKK